MFLPLELIKCAEADDYFRRYWKEMRDMFLVPQAGETPLAQLKYIQLRHPELVNTTLGAGVGAGLGALIGGKGRRGKGALIGGTVGGIKGLLYSPITRHKAETLMLERHRAADPMAILEMHLRASKDK